MRIGEYTPGNRLSCRPCGYKSASTTFTSSLGASCAVRTPFLPEILDEMFRQLVGSDGIPHTRAVDIDTLHLPSGRPHQRVREPDILMYARPPELIDRGTSGSMAPETDVGGNPDKFIDSAVVWIALMCHPGKI